MDGSDTRTRSCVAALVAALIGVVPTPAAAAGPGETTAITAFTGTPVEGGVVVEGAATFGGQRPVTVSTDAPDDANVTPRIGDREGTEPGVDLLAVMLSVPDPEVPELLVEWQVSDLPETGIVPEAIRYTLPFRVGEAAYLVQAKLSNLADAGGPSDPAERMEGLGAAFELRGDCTSDLEGTGLPHCAHLAWLEGDVDTIRDIVSARVPLGADEAPELVPGAVLRRGDAEHPDLNDVLAGYEVGGVTPATPADDRASFGDTEDFGFRIETPRVDLGIAPAGTDPRDVDYATGAALDGGAFSGTVAGTGDVFARACFAQNCAYRSLDGATLTTGDVVGTLTLPGHAEAFWFGGKIGDGLAYSQPVSALANCDTAPCFPFTLRVASPGAARLRIAIDTTTRNDGFTVRVTQPGGGTSSMTNGNSFNSELFIPSPAVGDYEIVAFPSSARNASFQMRAKLEATIPAREPDENGFLLPNLRPTAPYELNFEAPVNPLNGPFLAPDDANPPASVAGVTPLSCAVDETADDQVARCLRFSFGLTNAGPGNFDVRWTGPGIFNQGPGLPESGPLHQCVERASGDPVPRPAGEFEWHRTHLHTHYKDLIQAELHRVTDPEAGTMEPVGDGRKLGYSPADQSFADWHLFVQGAQGSSGSAGNCVPGSTNRLGMSVGWGDVYRYQRPGNFVNFGLNGDGLYVVRLVIDPLDHVLEENEDDNVAYTYVRVTLNRVEVLEYGRGLDPWDPDKQIIEPRLEGGAPW